MNTSNHHTAILVFVRPTKTESESKKLVAHDRLKNLSSLTGLKNNAIQVAQNTGLPTLTVESQRGSTFGEKLTNAFIQVFDHGYKNVIAIGGDCPELSTQDLLVAALQIENGSAVLGPDQRNGAYLIGLNRNHFDDKRFARLPWQTAQTFAALRKYLDSPHILAKKRDLNTSNDLKLIIRTAVRGIRKLLHSFILTEVNYSVEKIFPLTTITLPAGVLRGPPMAKAN